MITTATAINNAQTQFNNLRYFAVGRNSNSVPLAVLIEAGAKVPIIHTGFNTFPMLPMGGGVAP